jgi:predicted RNA-binding protein YlxR (DUF448 family)
VQAKKLLPIIACVACENIMERVSGDTWRVYKSEHRKVIIDPNERSEVSSFYAKHGKLEEGKRRKRRTIKRRRELSFEQEEKLFSELKKDSYATWGKAARIWYRATRLTGIRPVEWQSARQVWVGGSECIRVANAKLVDHEIIIGPGGKVSAALRNTQEYRNIPIDHCSDEDRQVILYHIAIVQGQVNVSAEVFKSYYDGVRKTLDRASRRCFPQDSLVNLYTGRHVFKDAFLQHLRADGVPESSAKLLVAVVMGHGSIKTQDGYGTGATGVSTIRSAEVALQGLRGAYSVMLKHALSQVDGA